MNEGKRQPARQIASVFSWLFDGYWPTADESQEEAPVRFQGGRHTYTLQRLVAVGEVADVYLATEADGAEATYLLKLARGPEGDTHLETERRVLTRLAASAGQTTYRRYLPELVEFIRTRQPVSNAANVFRFEPGFYTLEEVHEQHPALGGRHLAWIFNRLLTVLGFSHGKNIVHGAVLPCHVLIRASDHALQLVGWGQSVARGQRIKPAPHYQDWYPAEVHNQRAVGPGTDLYLAAHCVIYLAGGEPVTNRMPETVPLPMRRFLKTCLHDSVRMRPDDAWALFEDFEELLRALYGPPKFHELTLT